MGRGRICNPIMGPIIGGRPIGPIGGRFIIIGGRFIMGDIPRDIMGDIPCDIPKGGIPPKGGWGWEQ
jgi:hypothetical protein